MVPCMAFASWVWSFLQLLLCLAYPLHHFSLCCGFAMALSTGSEQCVSAWKKDCFSAKQGLTKYSKLNCITNLFSVGQTFLSFQWDILLLEAGFLSIFVAPLWSFKRFTSHVLFPLFLLICLSDCNLNKLQQIGRCAAISSIRFHDSVVALPSYVSLRSFHLSYSFFLSSLSQHWYLSKRCCKAVESVSYVVEPYRITLSLRDSVYPKCHGLVRPPPAWLYTKVSFRNHHEQSNMIWLCLETRERQKTKERVLLP